MKRRILIGNWKANFSVKQSADAACSLLSELQKNGDTEHLEIAIAPSVLAMDAVHAVLCGSNIVLAAQDVDMAGKDAFCGGNPAALLRTYCNYCFVGHSERRLYYGDTDKKVARRIAACIQAELIPILCVGEDRACYEQGKTLQCLEQQLRGSLTCADGLKEIIVLYEPIWALGTGIHPPAERVNETIAALRAMTEELLGDATAKQVRCVYAGSVNPENAAQYGALSTVDGLAVGSASLSPEKFAAIAKELATCN